MDKYEIPLSTSLDKFLSKFKELKQTAFDLGINVTHIDIEHITVDGKKLIKEIELRQDLLHFK